MVHLYTSTLHEKVKKLQAEKGMRSGVSDSLFIHGNFSTPLVIQVRL